MRTVSSPARPQSTLLPPSDDQPYPLSGSMSFTSTSTLHDELNSIWAPKNSSTDFSGMSHNCSPWPLETEPQFWTKTQVWQWFQHVFNTHRIDTASLPFLNFDIDGHQLCSMSYHDFILAAGSIGHVLFQSIEELKWNGLYLRGTKCSEESFGCNHHETDIRFPVEGAATEIRKIEMCSPHVELLRPEVSATPSIPKKKKSRNVSCRLGKYTPRGAHLWEFIRDILLSNESNPGLIRWEDRTAGVFRILRSDAVAQLWGKKKNNSSMTYEKLSRAMRYYYKRGILERVDGQRLVYKFGRNASGWKESDK